MAQGALVELPVDQARQLRTVLRLRPGAGITLFDGSGAEASATLTRVEASSAACEIGCITWPQREPSLKLSVALALLKPSAFELAVQKLTELGVARIVPLTAERAVVSYRDARDWERRAVRLERIVREAAEQSERVTLPELVAPIGLPELLEMQPVIVLVERSAAAPSLAAIVTPNGAAVAIGPEGGWSPTERALLAEHGTSLASLGSLILRAETAAIVAAAIVLNQPKVEESDR